MNCFVYRRLQRVITQGEEATLMLDVHFGAGDRSLLMAFMEASLRMACV